MKRPNIILITWHDLGDWLGCYERRDVKSPCLDRLAGEGARFTNYFASAPQCSPSRASIVTGRMPHTTGVLGLTHRGFDMHRQQATLPQALRHAGYTTHLIGIQHECRDPEWEGYDDIRARGRDAKAAADQAEAFLHEMAGEHRPPFFLAIGTTDVHRPFGHGHDETLPRRIELPPYLPDRDVARLDMATLCRCIEKADRHMGRVLDAVDRAGLADSTLVVFTTDHGPAIPRAKQTLFDPGLRTALLMRWPGTIAAQARYDQLLSNVDLMPTLLDLVRAEAPPGMQGHSFKALLTGKAYEPRDAIFAELTWHCHYRPMRAIRTREHKYIMNLCPGLPMLVEDGAIVRYGPKLIERCYGEPRPQEELYDLELDPWEKHDIARDPRYKAIRDDLRSRLMAWMKDTDDPILDGPVPNPEPETAKREFWIKKGGRFQMDPKGDWAALEA